MNNLGIGQIITTPQQRDAIHVAVIPCQSDEQLQPGCQVRLLPDGKAAAVVDESRPVGIVDPFLTKTVMPGQMFWLFLYPGSITSLRHDWTHPDFPDTEAGKSARLASEKWLREFCEKADCPGYDAVMKVIAGGDVIDDDNYRCYLDNEVMFFGGLAAHGIIPPEFWDHVEVVTGQKQTKRAQYFSCSC